jgi:hypothetical protein
MEKIAVPDLELLRYPIGKFKSPVSISNDDIKRWIDYLKIFPQKMRDAVTDLNDAQLDTPYRDGGWTIRQVVHHVPDSHMNAYIRFKLALTEDNPVIKPYMEDRWAELPDSKSAPIAASLNMLESIHVRWMYVVEHMSSADFKRTFHNPESKVTRTLEVVLSLYDWHAKHHLSHVTELRKRMNW